MHYQTFKDLKNDLESTLAQLLESDYDNIIQQLQTTLTDADLKKIERTIEKEIKQSDLSFAKRFRRFRRARTAQLLSKYAVANRNELTPSDTSVLNQELQQLRDIYGKIKLELPKQIKTVKMREMLHKKHQEQEMQKRALKEEHILNNDPSFELRVLAVVFSPVIIAALLSLYCSEQYNKRPDVKQRKQQEFQQAFRKHWQRRHTEEKAKKEKQLQAFRKMWRKMHQK